MGGTYGIKIEEFTNVAEARVSNADVVSRKLLDGNFLEYDMFVEEKTKDFTGRTWLYERCEAWLQQNQGNNFLWINGAAGAGKSTFAAKLSSKITTHHTGSFFCRYDEEATRYASSVIRAIAYYLNRQYSDYADLIISKVTETGFDELNTQKLFEYLVYMPTRRMAIPDKNICIIVDALDELFEEEQNELLSLLVKYSIPSWIKIIFTSRPESLIGSILTGIVAEVNLGSNENAVQSRSDVEEYVRYEIDKHRVRLTEEEINIILNKSENNFLYIYYLMKEVLAGGKLNVKTLPQGLGALYLFNLRRKYPSNSEGLKDYNREAKPIFEVMVAAKSSITLAELSAFLNIERTEIGLYMRRLSSFIVNANKTGASRSAGKKIYHRSFVEWLTSEQENEYFIKKSNGTNKILDYLSSHINEFLSNYYLKQCALSHIIDENRSDVMKKLLECDNMKILESIEYDLFYEYIERPKEINNLLKNITNEKIRRILITTFRKALHHGRNELLDEIIRLLRYEQELIRANMLEGEAYQWEEEFELAELKFNEAKEMAENEYAKDQSLWAKRHIGLCYNRLGNLAKAQSDLIASKSYYSLSYKMFSEIVNRLSTEGDIDLADSRNYEYMRDLMVCTLRVGDIYFDDNIEEALKHYKEYYKLCKNVLAARETFEMKRRLSIGMLRLGDIYFMQNNPRKSYGNYSKALEMLIELKDDLPEEEIDERFISHPIPLSDDSPVIDNKSDCYSTIDLPRERKELDFLHDLSLCYIRLGDAAQNAEQGELSKMWYNYYLKLCEFLYKARRTNESAVDLLRAKKRMEKI